MISDTTHRESGTESTVSQRVSPVRPSDRVAILDQGEVQQIGTPEQVYNEPYNLFVADFVGSPAMNTFDVEFDGTTLTAADFEYELSEAYAERVRERVGDTASLVLGIRPENIHLADASARNAIETVLDVLEPVGSDNYLYLEMEGVEECRVRAPGDVKPEENDSLTVSFDEDDTHLFRKSDGRNVLADEREKREVTA